MYNLGRPLKARWEIQKSLKKEQNLGCCKNGKSLFSKRHHKQSHNANRLRGNICNKNCCNINWLQSLIYKDGLQIDFFFKVNPIGRNWAMNINSSQERKSRWPRKKGKALNLATKEMQFGIS